MKKYLGFVLFCATSFCVGYLVGVPFSKSPSSVSEAPVQGDAQHRGEFVSVASHAGEPRTTLKTVNTKAQKTALSSNHATEIEKLTLPEIQARLQEMNGMEANAATEELEQNLVARWSQLDPIGATEYAAEAVAQGGNLSLLQTAATAWAETDPIGASQWAAILDSPLARDTALGQIFGTWSSTNPSQAASAIATLPMGSAQTVATSAVAKSFAKGNLNAALQWAEGLSGPVQLAATREIVNLWSNSDPEATGAWIMQQGSPQVRREALRALAENWAKRDPSAALDYAQKISDVHLRNSFVSSAIYKFSDSNPMAAANWLSSDAAKPPDIYAYVGWKVSTSYAAFDPGSAAGWASSITDDRLRNQALSAISKSWSQTNPTEAVQWIGSLRDAESRDVATAAFSEQLAEENPATAAQWASRISDPIRLSISLKKIVSDWKKIDPNAARSFVLSSTVIPADLRQKLLQ